MTSCLITCTILSYLSATLAMKGSDLMKALVVPSADPEDELLIQAVRSVYGKKHYIDESNTTGIFDQLGVIVDVVIVATYQYNETDTVVSPVKGYAVYAKDDGIQFKAAESSNCSADVTDRRWTPIFDGVVINKVMKAVYEVLIPTCPKWIGTRIQNDIPIKAKAQVFTTKLDPNASGKVEYQVAFAMFVRVK